MMRPLSLPLAVLSLLGSGPGRAMGQSIIVSPEGPISSIQAAVDQASPGDTIIVRGGVYRERIVVDRPLTLVGEDAWVDGEGTGHVIEILATATVRGLGIRGSGKRVDSEDAGIMIRGASVRILDNEIEDVLFGIYLKESAGSEVRGNVVRGKSLPLSRRGDGIRLWQSPDARVIGNRVIGCRDVVIYFSDRLDVRDNLITDGRYGLHYMYSDENRIEGNRFERNDVGAFLMYSRGIRLTRNVFADSRGATAIGVGLKDADAIVLEDNLIVGNETGVHLDNSPSDIHVVNRITGNAIWMNDVGIRTLPSVRSNEIADNDFMGNGRPVEVPGGAVRGQAGQNVWDGNYWSAYAGFDADDDGGGDTPYVYAKLADDLLSKYPILMIFDGSPALHLIDVLARFFPLLEPEPVLIDRAPRVERHAADRWGEENVSGSDRDPSRAGLWGWTILVVGTGISAMIGLGRLT